VKAFAELNGFAVTRGAISLPRIGIWSARLTLDAEELPLGPATLAVGTPPVTLEATVLRPALMGQAAEVLLVGGAGGFSKRVAPKDYQDVPIRVVLADLLSEVGERLSSASDPNLDTLMLPRWTRMGGPARDAIVQLSETLGVSWRVLPDGSTYVGRETYPKSTSKGEVLERVPGEDLMVVATESVDILPGEVFDGRRVSYIEYVISSAQVRSTIWCEAE
jgi:hypothetical protein